MTWLTDDEQRIWRNYLALVPRLQAAMNRQLQRDCGLSLSDFEVLVALGEAGPLRINRLSEALAWEQSRLSHQLGRMRARGLVMRSGTDDDRRGATVNLTASGLAALRLAAPGHSELVRSLMFDGLTRPQLRAFGSVIDSVLTRLDAWD